MTPEQFATVLTALAGLIGAVTVLIRDVRKTHELVNSRMSELLELTRKGSLAEGALAERERPSQNPGSGTST